MAAPKMANNGLNPFCIVELRTCLMTVFWLCSAKASKFFAQLLGEVDFGRSTLKLHLKRLTAQSLGTRIKARF